MSKENLDKLKEDLNTLREHLSKKPIPACIDKNLSYCDWVCPTCGELHVNSTKEKHCSKCGQAIDWSEYDN